MLILSQMCSKPPGIFYIKLKQSISYEEGGVPEGAEPPPMPEPDSAFS